MSLMTNPAASDDRAELFGEVLGSLTGEVLLSVSNAGDFAAFVSALPVESVEGRLRVLVDTGTAREVRNTFVVAARTAERLESGALRVRVEESPPGATLLVGAERILGIAAVAEGTATTLDADADEALVETARRSHRDRWEAAEDISLRTPPYTRVLETVGEELGAAMRTDVEDVLEHADRTGVDVDPVRVCLLMAARNGIQFYELGLWAESEGLASRATFSREKQRLEESGLIATEKVPADVGRPRQRLVLPANLQGEDPVELTTRALLE